MKQSPPLEVSHNNCLLKGPSALADFYTVTLGMKEHKVAFTKDISKFYQCVEADGAAQHVRRILWRFRDMQKWLPMYSLPPGVNKGDRPAGCIALLQSVRQLRGYGQGERKLHGSSRNKRTWMTRQGAHATKRTGAHAKKRTQRASPWTWRAL
jgi:hypothetical protein